MQKIVCDVIGTHLTIALDTAEDITRLEQQIWQRLENFEKKFSRFIEQNWLYDVNKNRSGVLDTDAKKMLTYMLTLSQATNGYFDPTVGKRLTELGYGKVFSAQQLGEEGYGDYRDIVMDGDRVSLSGNIFLEFGGVGKGYLIDVLQEMLDKYPRFLINFGGDLYGRGGYTIGLESPFASDEVIGTILLDNYYLACSAPTRRKWGKHHHLIDPKTGESAREVVATYIEGHSGMTSDAYATALSVMPWELAQSTLQKTPEISGVIVRYDGMVFQKAGSRAQIFG